MTSVGRKFVHILRPTVHIRVKLHSWIFMYFYGSISQMASVTEIISMLRSKDERGLSLLYDQYAPALLGQIINIVGDKAVAEEVLQQTMLKIWNGISSYDETKAGLFAWMSRVARNAAIDKGRLKSFQRNQKTEDVQLHVHSLQDSGFSTSAMDVDKLVQKLDSKYRAVIDHVYLMGYTQAEAAENLNIPLGTVKTRLRSAVQILREELKSEKNLFMSITIAVAFLSALLLKWN